MTATEPSPQDLQFLEEMGMREVEPGRWLSAPDASDQPDDLLLGDAPVAGLGEGVEVFTAIREDFVESLAGVDSQRISKAIGEMEARYPGLTPPDSLAAALRQLGIKCRAVDLHSHHGLLPDSEPGFRVALFKFPSGMHQWV